MNLCIRNSDKDVLIEANNFFINNNEIVSFTNIGNGQMTSILGKYKTKERALEVLDEIQTFIENNYVSLDALPGHNYNMYPGYYPSVFTTMTQKKVFQMPKD